MKKRFGSYIAVWAIVFAIFNAIALASAGWAGDVRYTASFLTGYIAIAVALIGQLICTSIAFKKDTLQKFFYNIPIISISYSGLITMMIVGGIFMAIPVLPMWLGIVICVFILASNVIAIIKAKTAADIVSDIDEKVKTQTFFIKNLTIEAETLFARSNNDESKNICKKVYEAIRYSDPMSNENLADIEREIESQFKVFSNTVSPETADKLLLLIAERNKKCKLLK